MASCKDEKKASADQPAPERLTADQTQLVHNFMCGDPGQWQAIQYDRGQPRSEMYYKELVSDRAGDALRRGRQAGVSLEAIYVRILEAVVDIGRPQLLAYYEGVRTLKEVISEHREKFADHIVAAMAGV